MFHTEGQDKTPEELSEVKIGNLPKRVQSNDCKADQRTWEKNGCTSEKLEVFNKELENIKNNQTEMKNTITEMKNTLEGINSKLNATEE